MHICALTLPQLTLLSRNAPFNPIKFVVHHIMRTLYMFLSFKQVLFVHNRILKKSMRFGKVLTEEQ